MPRSHFGIVAVSNFGADQRRLGRLGLFLILLLLFSSCINLLPTLHVLQEININAGIYYLGLHSLALPGFLVLPRSVTKRLGKSGRYSMIGLLVAFLAHYTIPLIPYYRSTPYQAAKNLSTESNSEKILGKSFSVLFANTLRTNRDVKPLRLLIQSLRPDAIAAVETSPEWIKDMQLHAEYPYSIERPSVGFFGRALFSKFPVHEISINLPLQVPPVLLSTVNLDGKIITLGVVHALAPHAGDIEPNHILLDALTNTTSSLKGPLIFAGDFNATPYSYIFQDFVNQNGLLSAQYGHGYEKTWMTFMPWLHFTLDHILYRGAVNVTEFKRLPEVGSDHFPLLARFTIE